MKFIFWILAFVFVQSEILCAMEGPWGSLEIFRQGLVNPTTLSKDLAPVRQADVGFIVEKHWIEKDNQGQFKVMAERICERRIKANVYDLRTQPGNPSLIPAASCTTVLDARDGSRQYEMSIDLGGLIYINIPNAAGRPMKNFVPWAMIRSDGGPSWPTQGFVMTPSLDLQEVVFNFGENSEHFFKNQTISITGSFSDKN